MCKTDNVHGVACLCVCVACVGPGNAQNKKLYHTKDTTNSCCSLSVSWTHGRQTDPCVDAMGIPPGFWLCVCWMLDKMSENDETSMSQCTEWM